MWKTTLKTSTLCIKFSLFSFSSFFFFFLFRAAPVAYVSSPAKFQIGVTAAGLHHSHSNTGSEPRMQATPQSSQQHQILNLLSKARDQICTLMDNSWICFCYTIRETPKFYFWSHIVGAQVFIMLFFIVLCIFKICF